MRISPQSLEIQGFRSFSAPQVFEFAAGPGLCCITGENLFEPELGSNGSGKSSIWEAFFWLLTGKSSRGLESPSLHNWDSKNPLRVKFTFLRDGEPFTIERLWKPVIRITVTGKDWPKGKVMSQTELQTWLGYSPDILMQSVYCGQFAPMFLDMTAGDKLKFLMSLMDMERWNSYRSAADQKKKAHDGEFAKGQTALTMKRATSTSLEREYKTLNDSHMNWKVTQDGRRAAVAESIAENHATLKLTEDALDHFKVSLKVEDTDVLNKAKSEAEAEIAALTPEIMKFQAGIGEWTGAIRTADTLLAKFNNLALSGYKCPTCDQDMDVAHAQKETACAKADKEKARETVADLKARQGKLENKQRSLQQNVFNLAQRINKAAVEASTFRQHIKGEELKIKHLQGTITKLEGDLEAIKNETPIYGDLAKDKLEQLRRCNESIHKMEAELSSMQMATSCLSFWQKGYKEIQLFLMSEITSQLEMAYNSSLESFGMGRWKISITVENETKSGTLQHKFLVFIQPPGVESPVAWESFCGGESQRLRLACAFGTLDLIEQLTGIKWDFEVWDEPTQHLSEEGMEDLIGILSQRALTANKQVWVIDHRRLQYASVNYRVHVARTSDGSVFVSEGQVPGPMH